MEKVNCSKHGEQSIVICCQHLSTDRNSDIYLIPEEGEDEATVWCGDCETARIKDKGWFDYADSVANWKIICSSCLNEIVKYASHVCEYDGERT